MHLTYPGKIPAADIVGRLMGPDHCGGFLQAVGVLHGTGPSGEVEATRVKFRPVPPGETQMTRDDFGQWWLPLPEDAGASARSGIAEGIRASTPEAEAAARRLKDAALAAAGEVA